MRKSKNKYATIYDVAEKANVSPATVSKVINNKGSISDEKRDLVMNTARDMGYMPNLAARYLKTMQSNQIMLSIPEVTDPFFFDMIQSVQVISKEHSNILSINSTSNNVSEELMLLESINSTFIDGLILVTLNYTEQHHKLIQEIDVPVVLCMLGTKIVHETNPVCDTVGVDAEKGIYMAVSHLIEQKHNDIGYIGLPTENQTGKERFDGYVSAMKDHHLTVNTDFVFTGHPDQNFGYRTGLELLKLGKMPGAVCVAADIIALGVYQAFSENGINVPDDIAIIGMDDINFAVFLNPPLSSVNLFQKKMGETCVELLYKRINGEESFYNNIVYQPIVIPRKSSMK